MRSASQKRYVEKNRDRLNRETREKRSTPEFKARRKAYNATRRNQANNRASWKCFRYRARRTPLLCEQGALTVLGYGDFANPSFVILGCGRRRMERLFEPFPVWPDSESSNGRSVRNEKTTP